MQSKIATSKTHFLIHLSINTLEQYMRSGLTYILNSFINNSPTFISLSFHLDELTFLLDTLIKYVCLKRYNSTYPQYFYGYQRDTLLAPPLKPWLQALILGGYPYVRGKLEKMYTRLKLEKEYAEYGFWEKVLHHVFPLVHLIIEGVDLIIKFKYLLDNKSEYYNLLFYILKVKLAYKKAGEESPNAVMELLNKPFILILFLGYKILNWWYSSSKSAGSGGVSVPVDPPFVGESVSGGRRCPLCSKKMTNPAVISSSGHVFCYVCVSNFVRENRKCPLTGVKTEMGNIHIIY